MKIEVLFPEFCNLYGDISNMKYLKECLPDAKFIMTRFDSEPYFVKNDVNLIYLGPMTEKMQEKVIEKLLPYKEKIEQLIENGTVFLITGNAMDVFASYIQNEDGTRIKGLGLLEIYVIRDMMNRHNSMLLGAFEDIKVVGFKSQFTKYYGNNVGKNFIYVKKGIGLNEKSSLEGFNMNNFFATNLIGPFLILNPLFTLKLMERMGVENPHLAFEDDMIAAYKRRLEEFETRKID